MATTRHRKGRKQFHQSFPVAADEVRERYVSRVVSLGAIDPQPFPGRAKRATLPPTGLAFSPMVFRRMANQVIRELPPHRGHTDHKLSYRTAETSFIPITMKSRFAGNAQQFNGYVQMLYARALMQAKIRRRSALPSHRGDEVVTPDTSTEFPVTSEGLFTPASGSTLIYYVQVDHDFQHRLIDTTEPADATGGKDYEEKVPVEDVYGVGYIYDKATSIRPLAQNFQLTIGTVQIYEAEWVITKTWEKLFETTEPGDGQYDCAWDTAKYYIQVTGKLRDSGVLRSSQDLKFTMTSPSCGTITFDEKLKVNRLRVSTSLNTRGPADVVLTGVFKGGITYTAGTGFDLSWIFNQTTAAADNPVEGTIVTDFGGGGGAEVVTHNAIVHHISLEGSFLTGMDVLARLRMRMKLA